MKSEELNLKQILVDESYLSEEDAKSLEEFSITNKISFREALIFKNLLTKDLIGQAIAEHLKVSYADLDHNLPSKESILKISEDNAKKYRIVIFADDKESITITTDNPKQKDLEKTLEKLFPKRKIILAYSNPEDIDAVFVNYKKSLDTRFSKIIESKSHVASEIVGQILSDAFSYHSSDIHIEPQQKEVVIRFRIDGLLQEAGRIPIGYYENILNRVKVQSKLRIDEHFKPQDGAMRYEEGNIAFDIRTSIVPIVDGEKIVLRILSSYVVGFALSDLGLSKTNEKILLDAVNKPFGMILVTGPTGSGKTTTLYSLLRILNQPDVNITTIEDPVEYKVKGINQIKVNTDTDLTFAKGLRSIVRQDPDIILVGEIRDEETAEIAVNAALTGHLLLSTFHANDAATAIPRLLDMNIEPFLLSSTLEVIIAQRLVRKICEHCKQSKKINLKDLDLPQNILDTYFNQKNINIYFGKGCQVCAGTGYNGRIAIFEFIQANPEIKNLILKNPSSQDIWALARESGAISLFEDGMQKVVNGITTIEEVKRVADMPV